jgi:hypothetical protein
MTAPKATIQSIAAKIIHASKKFFLGGTEVTASAAELNILDGVTKTAAQINLLVAGVAGGYKIARGVHTTVAASDTVVTGLATVVAIVATLESDPTVDPLMVSASIGNQTGAPAAGSVYIKTWSPTAVDDVTPIAATTFGKKVNWVAIGT